MSLIALHRTAFDLATPHGRMMATLLAGVGERECALDEHRIRSATAAATARDKRLARE